LIARPLLGAITIGVLAFSATANASVSRTIEHGESLWSIAAANGISVADLAAANGLAPDAHIIQGTEVVIPAAGETAAAGASAPPALGSYVVRSGDTLTNIAERSGVAMGAVAAMNGVDPADPLLIGTVLKLPTGASLETTAPAPENQIVPDAAPYPTSERVSAQTIAQVAAEYGVPGSLAAAIAWQESGFNNSVVSTANARGVMQILPGTWSWIDGNLAAGPLDANSAVDNVRAGVLFLRQLLRDTGWNVRETIASYYQGFGSVRSTGVLPQTEQYVNDVMALQPRFGG
jgi:soluble lytic murein transglycosylase-like protein